MTHEILHIIISLSFVLALIALILVGLAVRNNTSAIRHNTKAINLIISHSGKSHKGSSLTDQL